MRLRASKIAIDRGGRRLIDDLSFELSNGEALVVVGPNGAGKTSLLRAIAGLLPLGAGTLDYEGGDDEIAIGEYAHYVGHADALKSALTAEENLAFWSDMLAGEGKNAGASPAGALDRLGVGHVVDLPIHALSAGQRRRVALARLIAVARPLWLLDEPLTALDQASHARFGDVMREHLATGGLLVAATHALLDLPKARELRLGAPVAA